MTDPDVFSQAKADGSFALCCGDEACQQGRLKEDLIKRRMRGHGAQATLGLEARRASL